MHAAPGNDLSGVPCVPGYVVGRTLRALRNAGRGSQRDKLEMPRICGAPDPT
jgi:hypothetical protein